MKKERIKLIDITKIRFSPEIEVELPAKKDSQRLIERGKTLKGWSIRADGSLTNGLELSPENSNHLYYNEESLMQLKEILALIRVHKGKIDPKTCGLHIHVNAKNMSDKDVLNILKEWVHRQKYIVKRFKIHPERLNQTCKLLPKTPLRHLTEKMIHQYRNRDKYSFNTYEYLEEKYYSLSVAHLPNSDYGSLEFRLFSGTLNFKQLKSTIYWLLCFLRDAQERD